MSSSASGPVDAEAAIARALADGRLEDAAELLRAAGRPGQAAARYAELWRFEEAVQLTLDAGLPLQALGYALDAQDAALTRRVVDDFEGSPEQAVEAAHLARERHHLAVAARLFRRAGELIEAAECFEQAGEFSAAAQALERAGQPREAGKLYERCLREEPKDATSALGLARILCRFGRYEPAARALQGALAAEAQAGSLVDCLRLLVACLDAMQAPEAAAEALARLRRVDASTPARVPELLEGLYGHREGLRARAAEAEDALLGGRYRVLRQLGEGASGRVLLADDIFHARRVAVKVLRVDAGLGGRDALARFLREARVAASIDDAHVVRVYEADASGPFLVMEYMAGGTLEQRLAQAEEGGRALPGREVEAIVSALLSGLEAVHRRGIVHRDLKPQNVFFGAAGELKVGDFGVAHLADKGATATGAMLGTLAYMAPEQVALSANPTAATDLYALGVMLYRMLTGGLPFRGDDIALAKLDADAEAPSLRCPALGASFDALVLGLMARRPEDRPQSSEEVRVLLAPLRFPVDGVPISGEITRSPRPASRSSRPPAPDERYEALPDQAGVVFDRLLGRRVRLLPLSSEHVPRLKAFARADHPNLQAVYRVDEQTGQALLEAPTGERLGASAGRPEARELRRDLSAALDRIHAEGIAHGALDAEHVLVAKGRVVLLLSLDVEGADPADDRRALEALLG